MTQKKSHQEKKKTQRPDKEQEAAQTKQKEASTDEKLIKEESCEELRQDAQDEKELLKRQIEDLNDKHLRLIAEYDNYRKRTLREKMELAKHAGESILLDLLPVIDDFDRAQENLKSAKDLTAIKEGIDLIQNKFKDYLKQQGITSVEPHNELFDSELHEAVTKIPAPSEEMKGKIIDCILKGYKLNERLIRYPQVVVGE
jgi:molecular chaperone GrpE